MKWRTHYSPIGLDIGSHQVKMVQLKGNGERWKVHDMAVASLPDEEAGGTTDASEQIVRCLSTMLETGNFQGRKVVSVLPCSEVDIRTIHVPIQEEPQDIQEIVRQEAEAYLPYSTEEAILDAIVAGEDDQSETRKLRLVLVATRRQCVDNHLALLQEVGLHCLALDVHPLALSRLILDHQQLSTDSPLLIVDIGYHHSTAFVLWEGVLMYNRTFTWGGALLTQAIVKELRLSREKAELLKQQYGIDPWAPALPALTETGQRINMHAMSGLVYEIVRPQLEYLAQELERILSYWGAQVHATMIDRMLLSGGSAALKHLDDYLRQIIGIEVTVTEPLDHLGEGKNNQQEAHLPSSYAPGMATAVGLALRGRAKYG